MMFMKTLSQILMRNSLCYILSYLFRQIKQPPEETIHNFHI